MNNSKDKYVTLVKHYDDQQQKYSITKENAAIKEKYLLAGQDNEGNKGVKPIIENKRIDELRSKPLHGQVFKQLEKLVVNKNASIAWLKSASLKGETENLIIPAQDQALNTRYLQKNIFKQKVECVERLRNM
ncbi:unnamed protein product [Ceutorhynchus assimilis]|uniref:Uncharacterized protein n=1 Tax=Ceutorhynchus assimilis TaxID=467358 RepID=A0A9N9MB82_9CUCU|nr:unnamed protein product [Ceutorhynchus assimilis]